MRTTSKKISSDLSMSSDYLIITTFFVIQQNIYDAQRSLTNSIHIKRSLLLTSIIKAFANDKSYDKFCVLWRLMEQINEKLSSYISMSFSSTKIYSFFEQHHLCTLHLFLRQFVRICINNQFMKTIIYHERQAALAISAHLIM